MLALYLMTQTAIARPGTTRLQIKEAVGALLDDGPAPLGATRNTRPWHRGCDHVAIIHDHDLSAARPSN